MIRLFCSLLVFCSAFLWANNAFSTMPGCPTIGPSDPCPTVPWISSSTTTTMMFLSLSPPHSCPVIIYFCYRYCSPTDLEIVYRGMELTNQSCAVGVNVGDVDVVSSIKAAITARINIIDPPPTGSIPPCSTSTYQVFTMNWGFASCYKMYGWMNEVFMEACDMAAITCWSEYRYCLEADGSIKIDCVSHHINQGVDCPEPDEDFTIIGGNYIHPCKRYCDWTN